MRSSHFPGLVADTYLSNIALQAAPWAVLCIGFMNHTRECTVDSPHPWSVLYDYSVGYAPCKNNIQYLAPAQEDYCSLVIRRESSHLVEKIIHNSQWSLRDNLTSVKLYQIKLNYKNRDCIYQFSGLLIHVIFKIIF